MPPAMPPKPTDAPHPTAPSTPGPAQPAMPTGVSRAGRHAGRQLLVYTPDGPLGGTFTCTACQAQAWQPDLLQHTSGCPYRAARPAAPSSSPSPAERR